MSSEAGLGRLPWGVRGWVALMGGWDHWEGAWGRRFGAGLGDSHWEAVGEEGWGWVGHSWGGRVTAVGVGVTLGRGAYGKWANFQGAGSLLRGWVPPGGSLPGGGDSHMKGLTVL